ncbi:MAG TPA: hypothetical protein VG318_17350 [Actinomycetota bacterium]|nr:hypothetical protein [Actinomycetota bacterium]
MAEPVQRSGTWWQETKDGSWLRWDAAAQEWKTHGAPPPPPERPSPARAALDFGFAHWTTLLAAAGLTIYAIVRVGHDRFYERLHVTAEEVGLDQTLILGRAALYLFLVLTGVVAAAGMALFAGAAFGWLASVARTGDPGEDGKKPIGVDWLPPLVGATFSVFANFTLIRDILPPELLGADDSLTAQPHWLISEEALGVTGSLALVAGFVALLHWLLKRRPNSGAFEKLVDKHGAWTTVPALAAFLFASFVVAGRFGFVNGDYVVRGALVAPGPTGLLTAHAEPVCVDWLDGDPPIALPGGEPAPFMYLGQADGLVILYEPGATRTPLRVPAGKIAMQHDPDEPPEC